MHGTEHGLQTAHETEPDGHEPPIMGVQVPSEAPHWSPSHLPQLASLEALPGQPMAAEGLPWQPLLRVACTLLHAWPSCWHEPILVHLPVAPMLPLQYATAGPLTV